MIMRHMFKVDGVKNRFGVWAKGLWWLYGPGGLYPRLLPHYLAYFKPGFHPWQQGDLDTYRLWRDAYENSGDDAIAAADAVVHSLHPAAA
jgi:predicted metal-dependent hydrolase